MTTGDVVYSLRFSLIKILPEPGFDLGSTAGESCVLTARLHLSDMQSTRPVRSENTVVSGINIGVMNYVCSLGSKLHYVIDHAVENNNNNNNNIYLKSNIQSI